MLPLIVRSNASKAALYRGLVKSTSPLLYFPLNELAGVDAFNHGTLGAAGLARYVGATLAQTPAPGGDLAPYFDGANDLVNIYTAALEDNYSVNEGTMMIWCKVQNVGVWTDGIGHCAMSFTNGGQNNIRKHEVNNIIEYLYKNSFRQPGGIADVDWMCLGSTWSLSANQYKCYKDGAQIDVTIAFPTQMVKPLFGNGCCLGMIRSDVGQQPWQGWLAHAALWDTPLSAAQMLALYNGGI